MNWERHHVEVVRTAAAGNVGRAPTYSVSTSPALAATLSLDASSPTFGSEWAIQLSPRTSGAARCPVAIPLGDDGERGT